ELVNDNMPFLVDSVTAAINDLGLSTHSVIHPVMQVRRNGSGTLEGLYLRKEEQEDTTYESFIRCVIPEPTSDEKLEALEQELKRVLEDVYAAVEDWKPMRKKLETIIQHIQDTHVELPEDNKQ